MISQCTTRRRIRISMAFNDVYTVVLQRTKQGITRYSLQNHLCECEGATSRRIVRSNSSSTHETKVVFMAKTNTNREPRSLRAFIMCYLYRLTQTDYSSKAVQSTDSPISYNDKTLGKVQGLCATFTDMINASQNFKNRLDNTHSCGRLS